MLNVVVRTILLIALCASGTAAQTRLLDILTEELERNFRVLKEKADPPPYFLAYAVTDIESEATTAGGSVLTGKAANHSRLLDITLRLASPKQDNYHRLSGDRAQFTAGIAIPLEDNEVAIRRRVWLETDRVYRSAAQRLIRVRTATRVKADEEDPSDDFSVADKAVFSEGPVPLKFNLELWAARVRSLSGELKRYPTILNSSVAVLAQRETKYLVNTDGTRLQHGRGFGRVVISARGKAADGANVASGDTLETADPARMPSLDKIKDAILRVGQDVDGLSRSPQVEPFVGPAILSGSAAGVFFHEIFGHRVEGHRQKDEAEGQTFTKSIGNSVLPEFLSVVFDPTLEKAAGVDLNGWYRFDDEGVVGQRVVVVDKGILKTFLMSRSPIRDVPVSNGHGRRQPGREVVSRQSNLLVESANSVPQAKLRALLVEEIKRQGKPYGLYFQRVTGGYTTTGRRGLQAYTVMPLVVYRVYPDGRPDELVRGVDIVGTPLSSFAKIVATSDSPEVFNGYCGAESGDVPVSAVSPAILVSEIEVQKKDRSQDRPPLLPRPVTVSPSGAP